MGIVRNGVGLLKAPIEIKRAPPPWKPFTIHGMNDSERQQYTVKKLRARAFQRCIADFLNRSCREITSNLVKCFHGGGALSFNRGALDCQILVLPSRCVGLCLAPDCAQGCWVA